MHKIKRDPRIRVIFGNGEVKVFSCLEAISKHVFLDFYNRPFLDFSSWNHKNQWAVVHTFNDRTKLIHSFWNSFSKITDSPVYSPTVMVVDWMDRIIGIKEIAALAKEGRDSSLYIRQRNYSYSRTPKGGNFGHGEIVSKGAWGKKEITYRFRFDPVPGVGRMRCGWRWKNPHLVPYIKASLSEKEDGVKWRAKRSAKNLPDPWDDIPKGRDGGRCWKAKKIAKQWMKNL